MSTAAASSASTSSSASGFENLLAKTMEKRLATEVSTNWQRETGVVPISAYSEGQYVLKLKRGDEIVVAESAEEIGMKVWDCAALMSRWFEKGDFVKGKTILELGCGTGLLGFACAKLGAKRVVITDLASILPTMEKNVKLTGLGEVCVARALNWNDEAACLKLKQEFGPFDMIVASDVLVFAGDARMDGNKGMIGGLLLLAESNTEILMGCNKNRQGFIDGFYAHPPNHLFDITVVDGHQEADPDMYTDRVMLYRMWKKKLIL
ncbi:hypothetical protein BASA81_015749 [Batrachochytrium salamandrivorans]|nr:hypothetical protein BASA81_015749 [Batrachochytrium salamandrivorans]